MSLPSYIKQGAPSLAQRGLALVGTGAGPHMSITGGRFTLVDAAGNKRPFETLHADVVIVDINDHVSKMYRPETEKYDPDNPTPPTCFSHNGVAPSAQANTPQSMLCADCPHNVWGSRISAMGSKVKACRDEIRTAFIVPGMANNMFTLVIPPNSLVPWRAYLAKFQNAGFDVADVVTRLTFEEGVQGTLSFSPAPNPWLDDATVGVRDAAVASKASDALVGRLDRPRQGALPAPGNIGQLAAPAQQAPFPAAAGAAAQQQVPFPAAGAAAPFPTNTTSAQPAGSPAEIQPTQRKRRTRAEMEAARAGQAAPAAAAVSAQAPFRQSDPNGAGAPFGIQQGAAPPGDMAKAINDIFGSQ